MGGGRICGSGCNRCSHVFRRSHTIRDKFIFWYKMFMLLGVGTNALVFHSTGIQTRRNVEQRSRRADRSADLRHVFDSSVAGHYHLGALVLVPPDGRRRLGGLRVAPASRRQFSRLAIAACKTAMRMPTPQHSPCATGHHSNEVINYAVVSAPATNFAVIVISALSRREMGHPAFASCAALSNAAGSAPGSSRSRRDETL